MLNGNEAMKLDFLIVCESESESESGFLLNVSHFQSLFDYLFSSVYLFFYILFGHFPKNVTSISNLT